MIQARTTKEISPTEEVTIRKFFENPALFPERQVHDANSLEDFMYRWGVVITEESLAVALQKLVEAGIIKLKSAARLKYDEAAKSGGYTQAHQDILDSFMRRVHLIHDPSDDRTFENCAHLFDAMKGRDFTHDNLMWCLQYLQGRGGRGTRLHWEERPRQNPPQSRGHAHIPGEKWMSKDETNRSFYPSHASNPRYNGQAEREAQERFTKFVAQPEVVDAANGYWLQQAKSLVGSTHAETARVQRVVDSTPGGPRRQHEAGLREQRMIENERARGR